MANRKRAIAELTADDRGFQRGMSRAEKRLGSLSKMSKRSFGALGSVASGVVGGMLGGGALGATALFANEARKTADFERELTRLGINSRGAVGSLDEFRSKVFQVSGATGVAREDVLRAASAFVTLTGDGKTANQALELFAKVGKGTGASMEDIAASAAAMTQNLKVDPKELEQAFSILIAGGKAGAIELRDVASLMASIAPLAATFEGGSGVGGLADLSAALQLSKQGFGTAAEAATGLEALMGSIVKHADRFQHGGINVFNTDKNGVKTLRSFQEIVEGIGESRLAKDPQALVKAFGTKEAYQTYLQLVKVKGAWSALSAETRTAKDVAEDFAAFQASASGRMESAWNTAKNRIAEALTPEVIETFTSALITAVGVAEKLFGTLSMIPSVLDDAAGWIYNFASDKPRENAKAKKAIDAQADAGIAMAQQALNEGEAARVQSDARWEARNPKGTVPTYLEAMAPINMANASPLSNEQVDFQGGGEAVQMRLVKVLERIEGGIGVRIDVKPGPGLEAANPDSRSHALR